MKLDYHFVMTTLIVNYIILQVWKIINGVSPNEIGMRFSESSRQGTIAIIPLLAKVDAHKEINLCTMAHSLYWEHASGMSYLLISSHLKRS